LAHSAIPGRRRGDGVRAGRNPERGVAPSNSGNGATAETAAGEIDMRIGNAHSVRVQHRSGEAPQSGQKQVDGNGATAAQDMAARCRIDVIRGRSRQGVSSSRHIQGVGAGCAGYGGAISRIRTARYRRYRRAGHWDAVVGYGAGKLTQRDAHGDCQHGVGAGHYHALYLDRWIAGRRDRDGVCARTQIGDAE
jgi:hypothetical protein